MQYRPYNQPHNYHPPVNFNHNSYSYHTSQPSQNWNIPNVQQTPYDVFAKPELPAQWLSEPPMNGSQTAQNYGGPGGAAGIHTGGPLGGQSGGPVGGPNAGGATSYFYNGNGQIDFDKVLSTVGQLASTYHQVTPIVKQFGSLIKNFR
ncbi:YppG family protein [Oceanobacillus saliphilus]|uniref:YppG family protein n=1 Tax=Oceanobacillus saliphilus TaxID=2925834 RepID=UPI00201D6960|nr:YppG family protein [Oceanobacillus saliphilus]